jgi:hypothetical protein
MTRLPRVTAAQIIRVLEKRGSHSAVRVAAI